MKTVSSPVSDATCWQRIAGVPSPGLRILTAATAFHLLRPQLRPLLPRSCDSDYARCRSPLQAAPAAKRTAWKLPAGPAPHQNSQTSLGDNGAKAQRCKGASAPTHQRHGQLMPRTPHASCRRTAAEARSCGNAHWSWNFFCCAQNVCLFSEYITSLPAPALTPSPCHKATNLSPPIFVSCDRHKTPPVS